MAFEQINAPSEDDPSADSMFVGTGKINRNLEKTFEINPENGETVTPIILGQDADANGNSIQNASEVTVLVSGEPYRVDLEEIDVFIIAGQSNAVGAGVSAQSPTIIPGTAIQYYNQSLGLIPANDPVGVGSSGSSWPSFCLKYYQLTGKRICVIPTGYGGSSMVFAATAPGGLSWDTEGTLTTASIQATNEALALLREQGAVPVLKGILWNQGETDSIAAQAGTITGQDYVDRFSIMIERFRQIFGKSLPVFICRLGTQGIPASDTGFQIIRLAHQEIVETDPLAFFAYTGTVYFYQEGLMFDQYHYTQPGYNIVGYEMAERVISALHGQTPGTAQNQLQNFRADLPILCGVYTTNTNASGGASFVATNQDAADASVSIGMLGTSAGANAFIRVGTAAAGFDFYNASGAYRYKNASLYTIFTIHEESIEWTPTYEVHRGAQYTGVSSFSGNKVLVYNSVNVQVYTGTGGHQINLPTIGGEPGFWCVVKNRGSGNLTVAVASGGQIYTNSAVASVTLAPGESGQFISDGTYFLTY